MTDLFHEYENAKTLGDILRYERERRRISLEKVAQDLNIKKSHLECLESDSLHELPADIYAKNYLKKYAEVLRLDVQEVLKLYDKERAIIRRIEDKNNPDKKVFSEKAKKRFSFTLTPKIVRRASITLIVASFALYMWYQISDLSSPPEIALIEPLSEEITTNEKSFEIIGSTSPDATLTINGEAIRLSSDGSFKEEINLQEGLNIVVLEVSNELGRTKSINRKIFVE